MKRNYTKDEIDELILDLSSENQEIADFAMSALLIANPHRHLSHLIEALKTGDEVTKQRICYIFGGICDDRCVAPLLSMLEEKNVDIIIAAIDSLQFFPEKRILSHIINQLKINNEKVRESAIFTLGEFLKHGIKEALSPLVKIIKNENEQLKIRHLAFSRLKFLEDQRLRKTLNALKDISDASLYAQVLLFEDELNEDKQQKIDKINSLVDELVSEQDIMKQMNIENQLIAFGGQAAHVLIKKQFEDTKNVQLRIYARMIYEKLGLRIISAFKSLFESFDRFDDIKQVVLLQDIITIVSFRQFASLEPSMLKLLNKMNKYIEKSKNKKIRRHGFVIIKSDIHNALARYGSFNAIDDLKQIFKDGTERQFIQLIEAIGLIGDKHFLIPLINQYHAYNDVKSAKSTIKKAFKAIVKREGIKKNNPIFENLSEVQMNTLKLIQR